MFDYINSKEKKWKWIVAIFLAASILCFYFSEMTKEVVGNILKFIIEYGIFWLFITISFGVKIIRQLFFGKFDFNSSFISILTILLEAATFGVILNSSLIFLNGLVEQFWLKRVQYFDVNYFGNIYFLSLAFAAIFLVLYSIITVYKVFKEAVFSPFVKESHAVSKEEYYKSLNAFIKISHEESTDEFEKELTKLSDK